MNNSTRHFIRPSKCSSFFLSQEKNAENISVTAIYACLIPLIIIANLLSIIGIIKTKKNKFTSSQILFLALFLSDMTLGGVQLPLEIYLIWKSGKPSCLEIDISQFLIVFPIAMSGNILCVIPIDRYIHVAHSIRHERIVTNKILKITMILMVLVSCAWAASTAFFYVNFIFFILAACEGAVFIVGVSFNIAILINVKSQTKNSSCATHSIKRKFNKNNITDCRYYADYVHTVNCAFKHHSVCRNWTNLTSIIRVVKNLRCSLIPSQLNAILNSVIFISRNSRMKRYYYNLLNCRNNKE